MENKDFDLGKELQKEADKKKKEEKEKKPTIADSLVLLARKNVNFFFNDQLDRPYARYQVKDHSEH